MKRKDKLMMGYRLYEQWWLISKERKSLMKRKSSDCKQRHTHTHVSLYTRTIFSFKCEKIFPLPRLSSFKRSFIFLSCEYVFFCDFENVRKNKISCMPMFRVSRKKRKKKKWTQKTLNENPSHPLVVKLRFLCRYEYENNCK